MVKILNIKRLLPAILIVLLTALVALYILYQEKYVVPILMYHSISAADTKPLFVIGRIREGALRLNNVSPASFDRQMAYLKNNGYKVISLDEFVEGNKSGIKFPHNTIVITFDDGYADNYTNAFPILKKYHFPATIFIVSDAVGKNPALLNWDQIKEMSRYNISFGSHTRNHAYLPNQSEKQMKDEILGSKQIIEEHLGRPVNEIAYPCGGFTEEVKAVSALSGYKAAMTTNRGTDRFNIDPFELDRVHINNWENELTFKSKITGYYNLFRRMKPSH